MSPAQRTLKELRKLGCIYQVVERWNSFAHIRQDLFGFIDIVALRPEVGIIGIQCTSRANHNARKEKILASPLAKEWLLCGGKIEVWSWGKLKKTGWTLKTEEITIQDYAPL